MLCVSQERAWDLWVLVFPSAGLQPWLMRRLSLESLQQISCVVMRLSGWAFSAHILTLSLLLCLGTTFGIAKPDLWGKKSSRGIFLLKPTQRVGLDVLPSACTVCKKHTEPSPAVSPSASPELVEVMHVTHTDPHPYSPTPTHPSPQVLLLPIKIWRAETVRLSFLPRHRGSSGNIQTALPQAMKSNRSSLQSEMSVIKGCSFPVRVSSDPVILMPMKKKKPRRKRKW